jgi:hypothetical protein
VCRLFKITFEFFKKPTGGQYSGAHGTVEMQQGRASFVTTSDPRGSFSGGAGGGTSPGLMASFNTINTQSFGGAFDSSAMDLPSPPTDGGSLY